MEAMLQAIQANDVLMTKRLLGQTATAQEYETAMNLNNQVLNGTQDVEEAAMIILLVSAMGANAANDGYVVNYDKETDTFSVTGGAN